MPTPIPDDRGTAKYFAARSVVFGCLVLAPAVLLIREAASWVVNVAGAPMFLESQMRGAYTLKNTSGKRIASFALGCVAVKRRKIVIISKLPREEFSVPPAGSFGEAIVDSPYTPPYEQCVVKQKAKLALISVEFEDGSAWNFPEK